MSKILSGISKSAAALAAEDCDCIENLSENENDRVALGSLGVCEGDKKTHEFATSSDFN